MNKVWILWISLILEVLNLNVAHLFKEPTLLGPNVSHSIVLVHGLALQSHHFCHQVLLGVNKVVTIALKPTTEGATIVVFVLVVFVLVVIVLVKMEVVLIMVVVVLIMVVVVLIMLIMVVVMDVQALVETEWAFCSALIMAQNIAWRASLCVFRSIDCGLAGDEFVRCWQLAVITNTLNVGWKLHAVTELLRVEIDSEGQGVEQSDADEFLHDNVRVLLRYSNLNKSAKLLSLNTPTVIR